MKTFQKLHGGSKSFEPYWVRERVVDAIREFFKKEGFHEVEVPLLLPTASTEPFLEVFKTELKDDQGKSWQAFLPSSPEFALKKLLAAGSGSIFTITKSFRNGEGHSGRHNPEFTILEWYHTPGDYWTVAEQFERLMLYINGGKEHINYQGREYSLKTPWERISVAEAFKKYAGIDTETMLNEGELKQEGQRKGYIVEQNTSWEEIWNQIIANEIEPKLGVKGPTILYDYPISQAALARKADDPRFARRWEVYMAGMELGNCFDELTDWREQEARCKADLEERKRMGKTEFPMDTDFIGALKLRMPSTGGIAVGVDRLAAIFADVKDIQEILFFPAEEMFD